MQTPVRIGFPAEGSRRQRRVAPWLRWAVEPGASQSTSLAFIFDSLHPGRPVYTLPVLLIPLILFLIWEFIVPHFSQPLEVSSPPRENPFAPFIRLSHRVSEPGAEPRYARGTGDFAFVAYHVVVFSLIRQLITVSLGRRVGRFFEITRAGKLDRFGEQGYAFVYFLVFGAWGVVSLPNK